LGLQVRSEIDVLNSSIIELISAVNAFDGTLLNVIPQSLAVVIASGKVDTMTVRTTWLTQTSTNSTEAESSSIVTTLASLITAIAGIYQLFKKTLEALIVLLNLKTSKTHTENSIVALVPKVTVTWAPYLTLGQGILDEDFDKAISVYS
ncbi:hypothetical protein P280DRAFT_381882, partial [Massarina eburnea CBS 473.64]